MKKLVYILLFLMGIAVGQQTFAAAEPAKDTKQKVEESQELDGIYDYETFKAAEQICDMGDEEITKSGSVFKNEHMPRVRYPNYASYSTTSAGLIISEHGGVFARLVTPWGLRVIHPLWAFSKELPHQKKNLMKQLTLDSMPCDGSVGMRYKVLAIKDKKLPEPVEYKIRNYVANAVVAAALQKHQERYKKEKDEQKSEKE